MREGRQRGGILISIMMCTVCILTCVRAEHSKKFTQTWTADLIHTQPDPLLKMVFAEYPTSHNIL